MIVSIPYLVEKILLSGSPESTSLDLSDSRSE